MARPYRIVLCLGAALALAMPATGLADPWKDESGHGRGGREGRGGVLVVPIPVPVPVPVPQGGYVPAPAYGPPPGYYAEPRIPRGHLPPPGECRVWFPDRPAGQQPPPGRC
jgi:hypothetical protein